MQIKRVIEATKPEIIELFEAELAKEALAADPNAPGRKRTTKELAAHEAAAGAWESAIETLRDWRIVEEPPATAPSNGEATRRAAAADAI